MARAKRIIVTADNRVRLNIPYAPCFLDSAKMESLWHARRAAFEVEAKLNRMARLDHEVERLEEERALAVNQCLDLQRAFADRGHVVRDLQNALRATLQANGGADAAIAHAMTMGMTTEQFEMAKFWIGFYRPDGLVTTATPPTESKGD